MLSDAATALLPAIPESPMEIRPQLLHHKVWNCLLKLKTSKAFPLHLKANVKSQFILASGGC